MELSSLLKLIGWILVGAPIAGFLLFAVIMVREISKNDDESLKGILNIGYLMLAIGIILLAVSYGGEFLSPTSL